MLPIDFWEKYGQVFTGIIFKRVEKTYEEVLAEIFEDSEKI
jgi:hypothetical protein